ncbi:hypothetical protein [Corynebacterium confusum]
MQQITPAELVKRLRDIEGQYQALYLAAHAPEQLRRRLHDAAAQAHQMAGMAKKYEEKTRNVYK